jgi:hypothetical protein
VGSKEPEEAMMINFVKDPLVAMIARQMTARR